MNQLKKYINSYKFAITVSIVILCMITTLMSVGFSALNKNLSIAGDVEYEDNSPTLYNVLKKEKKLGTYAKEYTRDHRDSFIEEPTKSVYYWYAKDDTDGNVILDKWNVIFGGFCWQMFRTTDTGGVKLIYNGTPTDGNCNNEGVDQQIGTSKFNTNYDSPAYAGYMYNTVYAYNTKQPDNINVLTRTDMQNGYYYYYGTGVTYSSGTYTLTGTTQATWANTYPSSSGLYTCKTTTSITCSEVYYIAESTNNYMYGFKMANGNLLNYYNTNLTFGTNYTESNGTYTLINTTTITKADWYSDNSTYKNYYTCGDDSTTCTNLKYITYTNDYYYYALLVSNNYIYAKGFTYNSITNTYTLNSDRYQSWNITNTDQTNLATHHYTCFNDTGECQTLSYVYYAVPPTSWSYIYYINLAGGKNIENALNEMLYNEAVNTINSDMKTYIDNWYSSNMTSYTHALEDTIFCYNRNTTNLNTSGWNPNGGSVKTHVNFNRDSLSCTNDTDKFSVSNNKAKLIYPVGLASYMEMNLLYNGTYLLRKTGQYYWIGSPYYFYYSGTIGNVIRAGGHNIEYMPDNTFGVRPVVSLKPGTEYVSGTGSKDDPYVVE